MIKGCDISVPSKVRSSGSDTILQLTVNSISHECEPDAPQQCDYRASRRWGVLEFIHVNMGMHRLHNLAVGCPEYWSVCVEMWCLCECVCICLCSSMFKRLCKLCTCFFFFFFLCHGVCCECCCNGSISWGWSLKVHLTQLLTSTFSSHVCYQKNKMFSGLLAAVWCKEFDLVNNAERLCKGQ